jgi:hypothetical protein
MNHNPHMTATERAVWRMVVQEAAAAAREPYSQARAKALNKALAPCPEMRLPDLRPLPAAAFRAFLTLARGWAKEDDPRLREIMVARLAAMADVAGDILDGFRLDDAPPSWTDRADLR